MLRHLVGRAVAQHAPLVDHVAPRGDLQRLAHLVVRDKDRDPFERSWRMISWMLATVTGSMPVNGSSKRMILGVETRARAISRRRRSPPEREVAIDLRRCVILNCSRSCAPRLAGLTVDVEHLHHAQQVLLHGELAEDARLLGQVAHPAVAGAAVHRPAGDVDAVEEDLAGVGLDHAAGHAETGGLAGPVRARAGPRFHRVRRRSSRRRPRNGGRRSCSSLRLPAPAVSRDGLRCRHEEGKGTVPFSR